MLKIGDPQRTCTHARAEEACIRRRSGCADAGRRDLQQVPASSPGLLPETPTRPASTVRSPWCWRPTSRRGHRRGWPCIAAVRRREPHLPATCACTTASAALVDGEEADRGGGLRTACYGQQPRRPESIGRHRHPRQEGLRGSRRSTPSPEAAGRPAWRRPCALTPLERSTTHLLKAPRWRSFQHCARPSRSPRRTHPPAQARPCPRRRRSTTSSSSIAACITVARTRWPSRSARWTAGRTARRAVGGEGATDQPSSRNWRRRGPGTDAALSLRPAPPTCRPTTTHHPGSEVAIDDEELAGDTGHRRGSAAADYEKAADRCSATCALLSRRRGDRQQRR